MRDKAIFVENHMKHSSLIIPSLPFSLHFIISRCCPRGVGYQFQACSFACIVRRDHATWLAQTSLVDFTKSIVKTHIHIDLPWSLSLSVSSISFDCQKYLLKIKISNIFVHKTFSFLELMCVYYGSYLEHVTDAVVTAITKHCTSLVELRLACTRYITDQSLLHVFYD
jgi:hypothetical protein